MPKRPIRGEINSRGYAVPHGAAPRSLQEWRNEYPEIAEGRLFLQGHFRWVYALLIGGAGVDKRDTRVRRTSAHKRADVRMYSESASRGIDALVAGRGEARLLKVIEEIDGALQAA